MIFACNDGKLMPPCTMSFAEWIYAEEEEEENSQVKRMRMYECVFN